MTTRESEFTGDPKINYVNLILYDMKVYNLWRMRRYGPNQNIRVTTTALDVLLGDMPPHGQAYMREDMQKIRNGKEQSYEELQTIYEKAMGWLWKHFLSAIYNPLSERDFEELEREDNPEG